MLILNLIIILCVECFVDSVSIHGSKESESSNVKRRPSVQPVNVADYKDVREFYREKRNVEIIQVEVIELKIVESTDADSFTSLSDASNSKLSLYDRYGYYTAPLKHANEDQESVYDMKNLGKHRFDAITLNQISLRPTHDTSYFYPSPPHQHHNEIFSPNLSDDSHQHSPPGYNYYLPSRLPLLSDNKNCSKTTAPLCKTDNSESNKESDLVNNEKKNLTSSENNNSTVIDYSPSSPEAMIDIRFNIP